MPSDSSSWCAAIASITMHALFPMPLGIYFTSWSVGYVGSLFDSLGCGCDLGIKGVTSNLHALH